MFLHIEPIAISIRPSDCIIGEDVIRMSNPKTSRVLISVQK